MYKYFRKSNLGIQVHFLFATDFSGIFNKFTGFLMVNLVFLKFFSVLKYFSVLMQKLRNLVKMFKEINV